jgi:hypothetical protein
VMGVECVGHSSSVTRVCRVSSRNTSTTSSQVAALNPPRTFNIPEKDLCHMGCRTEALDED